MGHSERDLWEDLLKEDGPPPEERGSSARHSSAPSHPLSPFGNLPSTARTPLHPPPPPRRATVDPGALAAIRQGDETPAIGMVAVSMKSADDCLPGEGAPPRRSADETWPIEGPPPRANRADPHAGDDPNSLRARVLRQAQALPPPKPSPIQQVPEPPDSPFDRAVRCVCRVLHLK